MQTTDEEQMFTVCLKEKKLTYLRVIIMSVFNNLKSPNALDFAARLIFGTVQTEQISKTFF